MANSFYTLGIERFLKGLIAWDADTIKAQLVDASLYTANLTTDEFLSDIPALARIGAAVILTGKTTAAGAAGAADSTVSGVTGPTVEYVLLYKDTGTEATSPLICLLDSGNGLPLTPIGGDVPIRWDTYIFRS